MLALTVSTDQLGLAASMIELICKFPFDTAPVKKCTDKKYWKFFKLMQVSIFEEID